MKCACCNRALRADMSWWWQYGEWLCIGCIHWSQGIILPAILAGITHDDRGHGDVGVFVL